MLWSGLLESGASELVAGVGIVEAREARDEVQMRCAGGSVALLGNVNLRFGAVALAHLLVAVVVGLAMNEGDHVGILLNGAGFAQVAQQGALVVVLFIR